MTTMMSTPAPFLMVLTFGPSEPNQHCPLFEFAFRPIALKPSVFSLSKLTVPPDDAGAELAAGAGAVVVAGVADAEAVATVVDAEFALTPYSASFHRLADIV